MTEPSVEEIVARIEVGHEQHRPDLRALIASWRERGEALEKIAHCETWKGRKNYGHTDADLGEYWSDLAKEFQEIARAALKDRPAATDPPREKQSTIGGPWADVREAMRAKCEDVARRLGDEEIADAIAALKDAP
jgi:hypothetical protein